MAPLPEPAKTLQKTEAGGGSPEGKGQGEVVGEEAKPHEQGHGQAEGGPGHDQGARARGRERVAYPAATGTREGPDDSERTPETGRRDRREELANGAPGDGQEPRRVDLGGCHVDAGIVGIEEEEEQLELPDGGVDPHDQAYDRQEAGEEGQRAASRLGEADLRGPRPPGFRQEEKGQDRTRILPTQEG